MRLNGYALRAIRLASGHSGAECARAVGVRQPQWSNWEHNVRDASLERVLLISRHLGCDPRALLVDPNSDELAALVAAATDAGAALAGRTP